MLPTQTRQGLYYKRVKVAELREGEEFQRNRFVAAKTEHGCCVEYKSQDGTIKRLKRGGTGFVDVWLSADDTVDKLVDFVPDDVRDLWERLQIFGFCWLEFDGFYWRVRFEREEMNSYASAFKGGDQEVVIKDVLYSIEEKRVFYNGHRFFDVRDILNIRKISDKEAKKILESE